MAGFTPRTVSRFVRAVACVRDPFFPEAELYRVVWLRHGVFARSAEGRLRGFRLSAIVNDAAMNTNPQTLV